MIRKGKGHDIPVETDEIPIEEAASESKDTGLPEVEGPVVEESWAEKGGDERTRDEAVDHLRRLQAEVANYKKRVERERLLTVPWAQRMLVEKILPVLDDFDRALASVEGDNSPAAEGMALIRDKLMKVLEESGLERIAAVGEAFNPDIHEALMTESVEAERVGQVLMELVPGFQYKGQLVRPSRVQVGVEEDGE